MSYIVQHKLGLAEEPKELGVDAVVTDSSPRSWFDKAADWFEGRKHAFTVELIDLEGNNLVDESGEQIKYSLSARNEKDAAARVLLRSFSPDIEAGSKEHVLYKAVTTAGEKLGYQLVRMGQKPQARVRQT